jgi:hypothetical protein
MPRKRLGGRLISQLWAVSKKLSVRLSKSDAASMTSPKEFQSSLAARPPPPRRSSVLYDTQKNAKIGLSKDSWAVFGHEGFVQATLDKCSADNKNISKNSLLLKI